MASKNTKGESYGKGRTRNYVTIVYPEIAPENWLTTISESRVPVFISPLHDKDINATGEPKKPHYHVMAMFDTVKTLEQAKSFFETFGGVGCEDVKSVRACARYFCHLDNPEKAKYSIDDVKQYGGADYMHSIGCASDKAKAIREMVAYIEENDITCWADLFLYASQDRSDWFDALINSAAYVTKEYIKSRAWKLHQLEEK